MLTVKTQIVFQQLPTAANPGRNKTLTFNFVNKYEITSSWEELTDTANITLPKNIYYLDKYNKQQPLKGENVDLGNGPSPLFLKGDSVTITAGYQYKDKTGKSVTNTHLLFSGFITKVGSKTPFTLHCEDNMYKLKQIAAPNKTWPSKQYTLNQIIAECLQGSPYTVSNKSSITLKFDVGDFITHNETVADVLARIKRLYHLPSYFRGTELRIGYPIYYEEEANTLPFTFQQNIISDEMEYWRKDDVILSAVAYSINKVELETMTKDGHKKTKQKRLEVLVTEQNGKFVSTIISPGQPQPIEAESGERRTLFFWNVADTTTLANLAQAELQKYYYTGFRGKFTAFGIPFVKHGDNVLLNDAIITDRKGTYKVKRVVYRGGVDGLRQDIHLDYLIPT